MQTPIPFRKAEASATVGSLTSGRACQALATILQNYGGILAGCWRCVPSMRMKLWHNLPEIETPAAEALKVRFCRPHKMTASRTVENSPRSARQLAHQSEFIALNAIRTAYWITLPV